MFTVVAASTSVTSICPAPAPQSISASPMESLGKATSALPVPSVVKVIESVVPSPTTNAIFPVFMFPPETVISPVVVRSAAVKVA